MIKRSYRIYVRVTKEEYELICKMAKNDPDTRCKNGEKNLSRYVRYCVLNESGLRKNYFEREIKNLNYQIRKIGVNINQATKKINAGYGEWKAAEELKEGIEQIDQRFQEFMERLEEIEEKISGDGDYKIDEY